MTATAPITRDPSTFSRIVTRRSSWRCKTPLARFDPAGASRLCFDYGAFRGFDLDSQRPLGSHFTAAEVVRHPGKARFWPCGDHAGVNAVLAGRDGISGPELIALDEALLEIGGDTDENFARVYFDIRTRGRTLAELTPNLLADSTVRAYSGNDLVELMREAAAELILLENPAQPGTYQNDTLGTFRCNPVRLLTTEPWCACDLLLNDRYYLVVGETLPADPIGAVAAYMARVGNRMAS